jgi:hypothetical protein
VTVTRKRVVRIAAAAAASAGAKTGPDVPSDFLVPKQSIEESLIPPPRTKRP